MVATRENVYITPKADGYLRQLEEFTGDRPSQIVEKLLKDSVTNLAVEIGRSNLAIPPLVSVGPSGIGGPYQKELKGDTPHGDK